MAKNKNLINKLGIKRTLGRGCLSISLLCTAMMASADNSAVDDLTATTLNLGTPESFLTELKVHDTKSASVKNKGFALLNNLGETLDVIADDYSVESDGTLSMTGRVKGAKNSKFIMQGNDENVYGWVILDDQDIAYEYTTRKGQLLVNEIDVSDVRPICDFENHDHSVHSSILKVNKQAQLASNAAPHVGDYQGQDVSRLESKPGSDYVILLDTSKIMDGNTPRDRTPENLYITWQIVAASFSMFDVNVTTSRAVYDSAVPSRRGGGTLYTQSGRSSCHFAFGTSTFCTLYKENDAYGQGRIAAHEYGHLVHLAHDGGSSGGEYHNGLPDFQWVPVMGNVWRGTSWTHALYQWSKGEYSGSSNREDDFVIMQRFFPLKSDDNSGSKALAVAANGNVSGDSNHGQIETNTDTDHFTFSIGTNGGDVDLTIDRIEHIGGGMLDVQAYIKNSSGNIVAQSNKAVNRSAALNTNLSAGNYTLEITGGAEGTPSNGFSKYSSMGYYAIDGSITGSDGDSDPEIPVSPTGLGASNLSEDSFTASWSAVQHATSYQLQHSVDNGNNWQNTANTSSTSTTLSGLTGTDHWVRVRASNNLGSSVYSNAIYVELPDVVVPPSTPSGLSASNITTNSFTANWSAVNDAGSYDVQLWSNSANQWQDAGSSTTTSKALSGLSGIEQYFRVRATNSGGASSYSDQFLVQLDDDTGGGSCTKAPSVPTGFSTNNRTLSWYSVSGATSYEVQSWGGGVLQSDTSATNSYTFNSSYYLWVRVKAANDCGSSGYSSWVGVN